MLRDSFFIIESKSQYTNGLELNIELNSDHTIYQAHFPGEPITPGVCQIQIVTEILEEYLGKSVILSDIKTVKYVAVISPVETPHIKVLMKKIEVIDDLCKVNVIFSSNETIFSKMSMTYHVVRNNTSI